MPAEDGHHTPFRDTHAESPGIVLGERAAHGVIVGCDVQPLQNLMVLNYLRGELGHDHDDALRWCRHWIERGLDDFEAAIAAHPMTGEYSHGLTPGLADLALVSQVYNAGRFDCDLSACPTVLCIDAACNALPAFQAAAPENQPDAE